MKRWIPWITGLIIIGGTAWSFLYLRDMHPFGSLAPKLDKSGMDSIAMRFKGVHLIGKSNGKKTWSFKAGTIDVSKNRQMAVFNKSIKGSMIQNDKKVISLSSEKVVYNLYTQSVNVPGKTKLQIEDGPQITAGNLHWNAHDSKITCKKGISAAIAGSTLHGESLEADLRNKEVKIAKIKGQILLNE